MYPAQLSENQEFLQSLIKARSISSIIKLCSISDLELLTEIIHMFNYHSNSVKVTADARYLLKYISKARELDPKKFRNKLILKQKGLKQIVAITLNFFIHDILLCGFDQAELTSEDE